MSVLEVQTVMGTVQTCSDALRADLGRNLLELGAHLAFVLSAPPFWSTHRASVLARRAAPLLLCVRANLSLTQDVPRRERKACKYSGQLTP